MNDILNEKIQIREISGEETWPIRHKVMWPERNLDYVKLPGDTQGHHYGLFLEEQLISVISLFQEEEKMQFRKFATLQEFQGQGYGTALLDFTLEKTQQLGAKAIWCNARKNKVSFYEKFGLEATDIAFTKGGKEYVIMKKTYIS